MTVQDLNRARRENTDMSALLEDYRSKNNELAESNRQLSEQAREHSERMNRMQRQCAELLSEKDTKYGYKCMFE